jgi:hypothetical protein
MDMRTPYINALTILAIVTAVGVVALPATADPNPTIRHLMDEPVSMLDWGMQRLQQQLEQDFTPMTRIGVIDGGSPGFDAVYDFDKNEIRVELAFGSDAIYTTSTVDACMQALTELRHALVGKNSNGTYTTWWHTTRGWRPRCSPIFGRA